MKTIWGIAIGVLCGILGVGLLLLAIRNPVGEPIRLLPPPTEAPLMVHVIGAVNNPGLYNLPRGSRVQNAIQAAGGLAEGADTANLNLAFLLEDGDQVRVGLAARDQPSGHLPEPDSLDSEGTLSLLIDINTADQVELESLPGIGPVLAIEILQYRRENGPFTRIEGLQNVSGIGPATFEQLKGLITVSEDAPR